FATVFLLACMRPCLAADEPLPGRALDVQLFILPEVEPLSFDLIDFRAEQRHPVKAGVDAEPHSIFGIKRHIGVGAGYDAGVVHGSIGLYLTVAEWGRWSFGVPSRGMGLGCYCEYGGER